MEEWLVWLPGGVSRLGFPRTDVGVSFGDYFCSVVSELGLMFVINVNWCRPDLGYAVMVAWGCLNLDLQ